MKLGILGTGFIAKELMSLLDQLDIEKAYVLGTEKTREETEALKAQYGLAGAFYDYDDLLNSDVDTVYAGLPNFLHYSFSKQALLAGKHVIVEKPGAVQCEGDEGAGRHRRGEASHSGGGHVHPLYACGIED